MHASGFNFLWEKLTVDNSVTSIPIWISLAYFAFILYKGISCATKIRDVDDYLIGGRDLGWPVLLCTTAATLIGGGASVGAIGKTYQWGILMLWVSAGWYLQLMFSGWFIAHKFRVLPIYTVAGYLDHHFGPKMRWIAAVLSLLFSIGLLSAQLVAFGKIVSTILPVCPYYWALAAGAATIIIYNWAGGFWAVVRTDVYQFVFLLLGFALTAFLCIGKIPWDNMQIPASFWNLTSDKGWIFSTGTFIAFTFGEMFAPSYVTRFCAGKTLAETRRGIVLAGASMLIGFIPILFVISLFARSTLPNLEPQQALPATVMELQSPLMAGIILSAVMAAVMSSADSILNSATAIVLKDFMEPMKMQMSESGTAALRVARAVCLIFGCIATAIAFLLPDIIKLLLYSYSIWAPTMVFPCLMAAFPKLRTPSRPDAPVFIAVVSGLSTLLYQFTMKNPDLNATAFGLGIAVVLYAGFKIVDYLSGPPDQPQRQFASLESVSAE